MELKVKPRLFTDGKRTGEFLNVLPERLTLNYPKIYTSEVSTDETCFKEVKRVKFEITKDIKELDRNLLNQKHISGDWVKDLYETTKEYIFKTWKPEKFHLVGHSSGYDSRVISQAIFDLFKQHGKEWLGVTLFVENHGEGHLTSEILKKEGWDLKHFYHYGQGVAPDQLHSSSFQWLVYFNKFNGICSYPVNQWYDPYYKMYQDGIIPIDAQYYTGYGANEVTEMFAKHNRPISNYLSWHHTLQLGMFKDWGECIHPFWSIDWLMKLYAYKDIQHTKPRVNELVTRVISPHLNSIPRWDVPNTTKMGYKHVGFELMNNLMEFYRNSFYGKMNPIRANNWLEYLEWWGRLCTASLCEYLLKRGFKIT